MYDRISRYCELVEGVWERPVRRIGLDALRAAPGESLIEVRCGLGYALVDTWENPDKSCRIPFHPDRSLNRYHGFYFRRTGS